MPTAVRVTMHPGRRVIALGAAWIVAYFIARGVLEMEGLLRWQRLSVALFPAPIFAAFLWAYLGLIRCMDELERRIHVEALAIAFSLGVLLLTTLALLQRAVSLSFEDWSYAHIWFWMPVFYFCVVPIIAKRYDAQ